jgi:hypothetical protein
MICHLCASWLRLLASVVITSQRAQVLNGAISPLVATMAYVADVLPPQSRAVGFGCVYGVFAISFAFMPALGALMGLRTAIITGVAGKCVGVLYTLVRVYRCLHTTGLRTCSHVCTVPAGALC